MRTRFKVYLLVILLPGLKICTAQNFVPNGSFEQYTSCPTSIAQVPNAVNWMNPSSSGSPDYLHQCNSGNVSVPNNVFGYQQAHTGGAYAGFCPFYLTTPQFREYLEVQLTSQLNAGTCYRFEMFINLANCAQRNTDSIFVYFSNTAITGVPNYNPLPYTPQLRMALGSFPDTLNWFPVSGDYLAQGGENYLIIGNFRNDANTGSTLVNSAGQYQAVYFFIDDVSLSLCWEPNGISSSAQPDAVSVYADPLNQELKVVLGSNEASELTVYDMSSRKVLEKHFTGNATLSTAALSKGIYIYQVKTGGLLLRKGKIALQ